VSKKASDQDAYDVSPAVRKAAMKLLDELTKDLEAACRSVEKGARLSDDAIGTFRRRYRLSLQRVLSNPETAKMNHRRVLGPAMMCHGRVAAAIAGFHRTKPGALTIDRDAFLKAAHIIENECKSFAIRASAKRRGAAIMAPEVIDDAVSSFIWCW
jgi:ATP/maltotriose-dependent transcriptional regulator MalT